MTALQRWTLSVAAGWALAACGGPGAQEEAGTEGEATAAEETPPPAPGHGMEGMQGGQMMAQMRAHMQMMQGMSGDSMMSMMPEHRQRVGNMLAQMNRAMQDLTIPGDTAWNATADSARDDLTRMQQMSPDALAAFMPGHGRRVMRLLEMHREMVQSRNR